MKVRCPNCNKKTEWKGNEWRPFCSERCKYLDLAAWADEQYRIPERSSERNSSKDNDDTY